uniref:Putative secreted protein n=1 Tax=Anopheles marajoara TaxID=58244 RepID=A0A2M4CC60_9DIPT
MWVWVVDCTGVAFALADCLTHLTSDPPSVAHSTNSSNANTTNIRAWSTVVGYYQPGMRKEVAPPIHLHIHSPIARTH